MKIVTDAPVPVILPENSAQNNRKYYHFPSMEILHNDDIILCCKELTGGMDDPLGRIKTFLSSDGGHSWKAVIPPTIHDETTCPNRGYLLCHITALSDSELIAVYSLIETKPDMPLFNPETDGMQHADIRIVKSFDNGASWSQPRDIEFSSADIIVPSKIICLPDGTIGFPCEMHDHWTGGYREGNCSRFIKSYDRGETFSEGNIMVADTGILYGDARPAWVGNSLKIFLWTIDLLKMQDQPIHIVSTSDCAETWSQPSPIGITTQIMSPMYLGDDVMLAVHQDRFSEKPGLKALLSFDCGKSWDRKTEITLFGAGSRPDGTNPFAQFDQFKFGYSSILKTGDREGFISFWHSHGSSTGISVIRFRVVED